MTTTQFVKGERLTASKLNSAINAIRGSSIPNADRGSTGFRGDMDLGDFDPRRRRGRNIGWDKCFDIAATYDEDTHKLKSYIISRCGFQNGGEYISLDDQTIDDDDIASVTDISLVEISSANPTTPLPEEERWKVLSNIGIDEYPKDELSVVGQWRLYDVDSEHGGLVTIDHRDSFVQVGGSSTPSPSGPINLDLSSLNWMEVSTVEDGLTVSAQTFNYAELQDEDKDSLDVLSGSIGRYRFLARPEEGGSMKYIDLSADIATLSSEIERDLSAELSCRCKLTPVLEEGTKIAEWTGCDGNPVDIFAPTGGGGGECSCEVSAIHPRFDKDHSGQTQQYWENAKVAQFTNCKGDKTDLYAPNHIQFKGNAGSSPFLSNLSDYFELTSATDSNVRIQCDGQKITIGVYYL